MPDTQFRFGNALVVIDSIDPKIVTEISFEMVRFQEIVAYLEKLARFPFLKKMAFERTMMCDLKDVCYQSPMMF